MSFLFATAVLNAQISKSDADNLVLHTIVNDSTKITCFPNPAKDDITLSYTLNDDADVEVSISGILGNEVQHVCCGKQTKGYHSVEFDLSNIPDGIYLGCLKIDNNHKKTVKIIIKH